MVLPISGFLPVPLPMMIPFMGAQSLVIGKMFGEGFQYGKRKISAMPNEEFNKLTFEKMMSNAREEIKASVPTMNAAMQDMQPMVEVVVREFFNYITLVTKLLTGTGEGKNIFEKEGLEIGEWIAHQLGTHIPAAHGGGTASIPVGPIKPFVLPPTTSKPPVGTVFNIPPGAVSTGQFKVGSKPVTQNESLLLQIEKQRTIVVSLSKSLGSNHSKVRFQNAKLRALIKIYNDRQQRQNPSHVPSRAFRR